MATKTTPRDLAAEVAFLTRALAHSRWPLDNRGEQLQPSAAVDGWL
ncbi:MAG: hypothetical protein ACRDRP_10850 [Pseudonocardiaceae bacterium]